MRTSGGASSLRRKESLTPGDHRPAAAGRVPSAHGEFSFGSREELSGNDPVDQVDSGRTDSGRLVVWIIWLVPMNLPAMNSPAAWAWGPAWLAQASSRIQGVRLRSKASTAVLSTQLSVSIPHR